MSGGEWSLGCVLACAADCLAVFLQLNWTGPPALHLQGYLEEMLGVSVLEQLNCEALRVLSVDGDVSPDVLEARTPHMLSTLTCVHICTHKHTHISMYS